MASRLTDSEKKGTGDRFPFYLFVSKSCQILIFFTILLLAFLDLGENTLKNNEEAKQCRYRNVGPGT